MRLRNREWGNVYNSSGARGFFGEGYWYHRYFRHLGLDYTGSTFVAKTTTLYARAGNMPLDGRQRPIERRPKCIVVKPMKGVVLNSVGLSGPGADYLINEWSQHGKNPSRHGQWMISFMAVGKTVEERIQETKLFCDKLPRLIRANGSVNMALQINLSCPNVGLDVNNLVSEGRDMVGIASDLDIPILLKVNALLPIEAALRLHDHRDLDGLVVSNTIPWGKIPREIPWRDLFGTDVSPLAHLGGGGLSGAPLLPIVSTWIRIAKGSGFNKPIIGGGGILSVDDAATMVKAGADAIELGSVSILRPWRVRGIIEYANETLGYR